MLKKTLVATVGAIAVGMSFAGTAYAGNGHTATVLIQSSGSGETVGPFPSGGVSLTPTTRVTILSTGRFNFVRTEETPDPNAKPRVLAPGGRVIDLPDGAVVEEVIEDGKKKVIWKVPGGQMVIDGEYFPPGTPIPEPQPGATLTPSGLLPVDPDEAEDLFSELIQDPSLDEIFGSDFTLSDIDFDFDGTDPFFFGLAPFTFNYDDGSQDFAFAFESATVPEPASVLSLAFVAGIGFATRRKLAAKV
jgi:hypothetical protein